MSGPGPQVQPPQLKLDFASGGWVLLLAGLLGLYLLLHLTWPLLTGKVKPRQDVSTPAGLGFDLAGCRVPPDQLVFGAKPDSIPPLVMPRTVLGSAVDAMNLEYRRKYHHKFVVSGDRVVGVTLNGESRAYQLKVLQWHEVVNDVLGGVPIAVTYSPLCDSVVVYDRRVGNDLLLLAASGLLYNSNTLLYDQRLGAPDGWEGPLSSAEAGARWYQSLGCAQCHTLDGERSSGPSLKDLYLTPVLLTDGTAVGADPKYLADSILTSGSQVVAGYEPRMPDFTGRLSDKAVDELVTFIKLQSKQLPAAQRQTLEAETTRAREQRAAPRSPAQQQIYDSIQQQWQPAQASLWSQLGRKAISGWAAGQEMAPLPCELTHWGDWQVRHPDTTLLSTDTDVERDYTQNAYGAYFDRQKLRFPVEPQLPPGRPAAFAPGLAAQQAGTWHAFSYPSLAAAAQPANLPEEAAAAKNPHGDPDPLRAPLAAQVDGTAFIYEPVQSGMEPATARLASPQGEPVVYGLWFALYAFGYAK